MKEKIIIVTILLVLGAGAFRPACAQANLPRQVNAEVFFPIGEKTVDPDFRNNGERMDAFISTLQKVLYDSSYVVSRLVVVGAASPEGKEKVNIALGRLRAQALADYIMARTGLEPGSIEVVNGGENWEGLRAMIENSSMPYRNEMLRIMDENPHDRDERKRKMQYYADSKPWLWMYEHFFHDLRTGGSGTQGRERLSEQSSENWNRIDVMIARSNLDETSKTDLRESLRRQPDPRKRLELLQETCPDSLYNYLQEQIVGRALNEPSSLSNENWKILREMIAPSDMPAKMEILRIIDEVPATQGRQQELQKLDDGESYNYILGRFYPALLYGISLAAQENWNYLTLAVENSGLENKSTIMEVIRTTTPGMERERAVKALDGGESWHRMCGLLLSELLTNTRDIPLTGSGMSFYYEPSPESKNQPTPPGSENSRIQAGKKTPETSSIPDFVRQLVKTETKNVFVPKVALKTDLMLWAGMIPEFKMGTWMPNLALEVFFAKRWSLQLGGVYSDWDSFSGDKGLFAVSAGDFEIRHWFGKKASYKGFILGLFGKYGQYDVQESVIGQTGSFYSAGLGVGYLLPLGKRWGLEAEARGGYRWAENIYYDIQPEHLYFNRSESSGSFVPEFKLNLVYRLGKMQK